MPAIDIKYTITAHFLVKETVVLNGNKGSGLDSIPVQSLKNQLFCSDCNIVTSPSSCCCWFPRIYFYWIRHNWNKINVSIPQQRREDVLWLTFILIIWNGEKQRARGILLTISPMLYQTIDRRTQKMELRRDREAIYEKMVKALWLCCSWHMCWFEGKMNIVIGC